MNARDYTARHLANMPAERRAMLEAEWLPPDAVRAKRMREQMERQHAEALKEAE